MEDLLMVSNPYWSVNTLLMKSIGLWPPQKMYVKLPLRIIVISSITFLMIAQVVRGIEEWGINTLIVIETIVGFLLTISPIVKYIIVINAETKLQNLYKEIMRDWNTFKEDGEQKILAKRVGKVGRFLTVYYTVYFHISCSFFAIAPALIPTILDIVVPKNVSRAKALCVYGEFFVDEQKYYYQLLFLTVCSVSSVVCIYTTIDTTYAFCVQHIVGLFAIVEYHLEKASRVTQDTDKYNLNEAESTIHNCVLHSVEIHNKSIEFCNLLQTTYTMSYFFTMGTTVICLSLGMVDVMLNMDDYANFIRLSCAWVSTVLYLFFVNVPGQKISDASSKIFYSVYFCEWYAFPLKTQRLLRFMMTRSMKSCQFTAGPLLTMNLETCSVILRTAMSYFTFVLAVS